MRAAFYTEFKGDLAVEELPEPRPAPDGVVIRVEASGICRSDWHGWMGHDADIHLPHVPGHELAGVVEEVGGDVQRWQRGDRVTVPFAVGCGSCPQCQAGQQHICDDYFQPGFTAWGSFAQYVAIPYADVNLVRLPEEIDFVTAASLGCRFITSFRAVVDQGRLKPGEWVVVHGCGGVGLSAVMIAAAMGGNVVGVDIRAESLAMAQDAGAAHVLNAAGEADLIGAVHELTGGGAHLSLDALGSLQTCRNSLLSLRKRGRHVQVGLMAADDSNPPLPMGKVIGMELEILGSHGMQAHRYPPMLEMIQAGSLAPGKLVSRTVTLDESLAVLSRMGEFKDPGVTVIDTF